MVRDVKIMLCFHVHKAQHLIIWSSLARIECRH